MSLFTMLMFFVVNVNQGGIVEVKGEISGTHMPIVPTALPTEPDEPDALGTQFKYNIWEHLALSSNTTDFCLSNTISANDLLGNSVVPVCYHAPEDIVRAAISFHGSFSLYANFEAWGEHLAKKPPHAIEFITAKVATFNTTCIRFIGCEQGCYTPHQTYMNCSEYETIQANKAYITLPPGWFFSCGVQNWNYLPPNLASGSECCLSKMTVVLPSKQDLINARAPKRTKRGFETHGLEPDCDSKVVLWNKAEYIAMAATLLGSPVLAVRNARTISKLACWSVKSLNQTSAAISLLNREQRELRHAILANRAAIDFLLLKHHLGCAALLDMCCFNLTNSYNTIEHRLQILHELVQEVKEHKDFVFPSGDIAGWARKIWAAMWAWLPDWGWIADAIKYGIIIIVAILVLGLLVKCLTCLRYCFSDCCKLHSPAPPPYSPPVQALSLHVAEDYPTWHQEKMWGVQSTIFNE